MAMLLNILELWHTGMHIVHVCTTMQEAPNILKIFIPNMLKAAYEKIS